MRVEFERSPMDAIKMACGVLPFSDLMAAFLNRMRGLSSFRPHDKYQCLISGPQYD